MASLFEMFATNHKAEIEGIEFRFGVKNEDNSEPIFRLARLGAANKRWKALLEKETKPYATQIKNDSLAPELDEEITMKVFCTTVLIGWRDLIMPEVFQAESKVDYSVDNAIKLMKALPELYATLREHAAKMSNFREAQVAEETKN
jgi:hypothetical protein